MKKQILFLILLFALIGVTKAQTITPGTVVYDVPRECFKGWDGTQWRDLACKGPTFTFTSCTTAEAGTLILNEAPTGVTQTITVNVTSLGPYALTTNTVNGVTFSASGTFSTTGSHDVVLSASGTPTATGTANFTIQETGGCSFSRTIDPPPPCPAPDALVCQGNTTLQEGTNFESELLGGGTGGDISWTITPNPNTGTGSLSGTGTSTGVIMYNTTGTYTVTYTSVNSSNPSGCTGSASVSCSTTITVVTNLFPPGTVHCDPNNITPVVEVVSPTGEIWMDRNLGASKRYVPGMSDPENAYGDLYQWGRRADGHQCRNSTTTTVSPGTNTVPGHDMFITETHGLSRDWRDNLVGTLNNNLWAGTQNNNPCPTGYRLPFISEWWDEITFGSGSDANLTPVVERLFLTFNGGQRRVSSSTPGNTFITGNTYYWTANFGNPSNTNYTTAFSSDGSCRTLECLIERYEGSTVRCIKN